MFLDLLILLSTLLSQGVYKANVIDNFTGCTNIGDSTKAIYFAETPNNYYALSYYSPTNVMFLNPSLGATLKARWFKDGLEITGQSGKQIPFLGDVCTKPWFIIQSMMAVLL
jgi:hypothetical protein